ncbi:MAG TPA: hypothetical protein VJ951_11450 [Bacteroidales bacterium]|nr:hypothetical protein [Bacteroidales bacterium]
MKSIKVFVIIISIVIVIPILGFAMWFMQESKPLSIAMINKSILKYKGSENQSFNYILNKEKYFTDWDMKYNLKNDYFGVHWLKDKYRVKYPSLRDVEKKVNESDVVYFSDMYGIRTNHLKNLSKDGPDKLEYGGVNNTDYTFVKALISHNKPTIIECSFLAPPTEPLVRYNFETMTDIYFVGWNGKYLNDLSIDPDLNIELNCIDMYEKYTGKKWNFSGPGVVFYNVHDERVYVLQENIDINASEGLIITSEEGINKYNLPEKIGYNGRFTVLHPGDNKVVSYFELNPTAEGKRKLNELGIPDKFPALIEAGDNLYYLAGDFGKNRVNMFLSQMNGINDVVHSMKKRSISASNFFHAYYYPFMSKVLKDAYLMKQE